MRNRTQRPALIAVPLHALGALWLMLLACSSGPVPSDANSDLDVDVVNEEHDTNDSSGAGPAVPDPSSVTADAEMPATASLDPGLTGLCARDRSDAVRDVFCAAVPPQIRSLSDLQQALHIIPSADGPEAMQLVGSGGQVTVLGHSTALSGHLISPINPRLIMLGEGVTLAFQRGVQKVEVIARSRGGGVFNFYLFEFQQACNQSGAGCMPGDLYTPQVESDWSAVSIQDDEDLKNTPSDCLQCHKRGGVEPRLLMRELESPWTHFLQPAASDPDASPGPGVQGQDLMQDYLAAKGEEPYGGFPVQNLVGVAPFVLQIAVGLDQPVLFDAPGIETERWPYDEETGYALSPGPSPTWEAAWEAFKRGEQLALPYIEPRATDPQKQAQLSQAYARYRAGEIGAAELPDLADIFPDDPQARARIGLQVEPYASPEDALIQACGSCHNDVLDQQISRARFNIDLWKMDADEIAVAIERIERAPGAPGVMPPPEARQLDPASRDRLLSYLRQVPLSHEPDERLRYAAEMGMAGGADRKAFERY